MDVEGKELEGEAVAANKLRKLDGTTTIVGQMYGAKITDDSVADATTTKKTNAPFTQKPYKNVQYGSLTSALHAQSISTLLDGGEAGTKIAKYGYTGTPNTEDNAILNTQLTQQIE